MKILNQIKKAFQESSKQREILLEKYKLGDYYKVNNKKEIRKYHCNAPKGHICVINNNHIYVSRGKKYEWERYKYDKKKDMLFLVSIGSSIDGEVGSYYTFLPLKDKKETIKDTTFFIVMVAIIEFIIYFLK